MTSDDSKTTYDAAIRSVAMIGRTDRVRIELTGPDRVKVLNNLTTNDIKRLAPGRGCEAFLTSGQGRTLALLQVHAEEDRLLLRADPGTAGAILGHLGKYGLFEDATPSVDVSASSGECPSVRSARGRSRAGGRPADPRGRPGHRECRGPPGDPRGPRPACPG